MVGTSFVYRLLEKSTINSFNREAITSFSTEISNVD